MDEYDELLKNMKDRERMEEILQGIFVSRIQFVLSSATTNDYILNHAECMMVNPVRILLNRKELSLNWIQQYFVMAEDRDSKLKKLLDFFCGADIAGQTIIFCNRKLTVNWLIERLESRNYKLAHIHANMDQPTREQVMKEFKENKKQVLVTSDLLHRGIDVQQISHVINFDFPERYSSYIHRIGRSGRFGRNGTAITFVEPSEVQYLQRYQKLNNSPIEELVIENCMPSTNWLNLFLAAIICMTRESNVDWAQISQLMESKIFMTICMDAKRCEDVFSRLVGLYVDVLDRAHTFVQASQWFVYFDVMRQIDLNKTGIDERLVSKVYRLWHRLIHNDYLEREALV